MMEISTLLSLLLGLSAICTVGLAFADTQEDKISELFKTVHKLEKLVLKQNEKLKHMETLQKRLSNAERRMVVIQDLNMQMVKAGEKCKWEIKELQKRLVNVEGLHHYLSKAELQPVDNKEMDTQTFNSGFREYIEQNGVAETHQHNDDINKTHQWLLSKQYNNFTQDFANEENSQERVQIDKHYSKSQHMNENRTKHMVVAGHVAFSAYLSENLSGLGPNQTIKFDRLDYNEGGAFDTTTGMFSCPASGTYFFTASILSYYGNYVETAIVLNGEEQAIVYAGNPPASPKYDQGSNSAIVHCDVGQNVWVKLRENYGNAVYGGRYSKFSGYMLW